MLGIKGNENLDEVMIHELNSASDVWLEFPADLQKPLDAEYFYSQTPFTVTMEQTENGKQEVTSIRQDVNNSGLLVRLILNLIIITLMCVMP